MRERQSGILGTFPHDTVWLAVYVHSQVRIAGCAALQAFCSTMQVNYCETNSGYLAAGVIIHMDDADTAVQVGRAACDLRIYKEHLLPLSQFLVCLIFT